MSHGRISAQPYSACGQAWGLARRARKNGLAHMWGLRLRLRSSMGAYRGLLPINTSRLFIQLGFLPYFIESESAYRSFATCHTPRHSHPCTTPRATVPLHYNIWDGNTHVLRVLHEL